MGAYRRPTGSELETLSATPLRDAQRRRQWGTLPVPVIALVEGTCEQIGDEPTTAADAHEAVGARAFTLLG